MTILTALRRLLLVPIAALALVVGMGGVASAGPASAAWDELTGEAYFSSFEVLSGPQELGGSGRWRDTLSVQAQGFFVLADGTVLAVSSDSEVARTYNQAFYDFFYGSDYPSDWDGFFVGMQVLTLGEGVTCQGPLRGTFAEGYQAPARANLRCDDGSALRLSYEGSPELLGFGYDQITGHIRR